MASNFSDEHRYEYDNHGFSENESDEEICTVATEVDATAERMSNGWTPVSRTEQRRRRVSSPPPDRCDVFLSVKESGEVAQRVMKCSKVAVQSRQEAAAEIEAEMLTCLTEMEHFEQEAETVRRKLYSNGAQLLPVERKDAERFLNKAAEEIGAMRTIWNLKRAEYDTLIARNANASEINVLLIGGASSGKMTLVNAIADQFAFDSFQEAKMTRCRSGRRPAAASGFRNSVSANKSSFVADAETYTLTLAANVKIRFLNTPGFHELEDAEEFAEKVKKVTAVVKRFHRIHAIWMFTYYGERDAERLLKKMLSVLDPSTWANVKFLATRTSACSEDEARSRLRAALEALNRSRGYKSLPPVPCDDSSMCFVSVRSQLYLAATSEELAPENPTVESYLESDWRSAAQVLVRLLDDVIESRLPVIDAQRIVDKSAANMAASYRMQQFRQTILEGILKMLCYKS